MPVSTGGGTRPQWSSDGRTLYFERGRDLMQVEVVGGDLAGTPRPAHPLNGGRAVGIGPDGRVLLQTFAAARPSQAVLTLNWISELRAKVGPATAPSPR